MDMTEFLNSKISISWRTIFIAISIVLASSGSFWVGYGNIMSKLTAIQSSITIQNLRIEYEIQKGAAVHNDFEKRVTRLEAVR
jgi:hypothetical protein